MQVDIVPVLRVAGRCVLCGGEIVRHATFDVDGGELLDRWTHVEPCPLTFLAVDCEAPMVYNVVSLTTAEIDALKGART